MSLGDTREIMATMQEIIALLEGAEVKVKKIKDDVSGEDGTRDISMRQQLRIINLLTMTIADATGGNKSIDVLRQKISEASNAAMRFYMLMIVIQELQAGIIGGPWGIAYGVVNLIGFGISLNTLGQ